MKSFEILRADYEPMGEMEVPPEAMQAFSLAMGAWISNGVHGLWLEPECGDGHSNPEDLAVSIGSRFSALGHAFNGKNTKSPIEDRMLGALLWLDIDWAGFPRFDYLDGPLGEVGSEPTANLQFWISAQAPVGKYKADFLVWFKLGRHVGGVAVECDGHAFHEKSKEQASRDKERDRFFLKAGFPVMRFSGSDIYKDAVACANEVAEALEPILFRVSKDGGLF